MKLISISLFIVWGILISCKTKEQVETDRIAGGWRITQVSYAQRGSATVDSTVSYSKSLFDFGSCKLDASTRECFGYYSLNGVDRTAVTYSISVAENKLNLSAVDQNNRRGIDLTGSFQIEKASQNLMLLSGPAGYIDSKGRFHLQALDVKLTLVR